MKCLATGTMQEASGCLYEGTLFTEFLPMVAFSLPCKMIVFCPNRPTQTTNVTCTGSGDHANRVARVVVVGRTRGSHIAKVRIVAGVRDESHQFAEPPPRMILIQNATAVLLFQFIKPALIRLHPRFYVSFLIDEYPVHFSRSESLIGRISLSRRRSFEHNLYFHNCPLLKFLFFFWYSAFVLGNTEFAYITLLFTIFADSMRSFPFDSRYLFGITFSLWHASIVNFSSSCAVFKNSIADVLLFLANTLIFFPLLSGRDMPAR